jgi:hypothetical protein
LILADTGPLVALFDPADADHARCVQVLKTIEEPIGTTIPALTEAFEKGNGVRSIFYTTPDSLSRIRNPESESESGDTIPIYAMLRSWQG